MPSLLLYTETLIESDTRRQHIARDQRWRVFKNANYDRAVSLQQLGLVPSTVVYRGIIISKWR